MPKLTKAQAARGEKLQAAVDVARDAIFRTQSRTDIPFQTCVELAPAEIVAEYQEACERLTAWEDAMAREGRGYRAPGSYRFTAY